MPYKIDMNQRAYSRKTLMQAVRFGGVGILNTVIDFLILNLLTHIFGVGGDGGYRFTLFKVISFSVAVFNSYLLNKRWVFRHISKHSWKEGLSFLGVSLVGLIINTVISTIIFKLLTFQGVESFIAVNSGALVGTLFVLIWNYSGYQRFVFKKP